MLRARAQNATTTKKNREGRATKQKMSDDIDASQHIAFGDDSMMSFVPTATAASPSGLGQAAAAASAAAAGTPF